MNTISDWLSVLPIGQSNNSLFNRLGIGRLGHKQHEADRFPSIYDADLDALLKARDTNNTKNVIKYGLRILRDFCVQREILFEEFEQSKEEMCETLKAFYAAMRSILVMFY